MLRCNLDLPALNRARLPGDHRGRDARVSSRRTREVESLVRSHLVSVVVAGNLGAGLHVICVMRVAAWSRTVLSTDPGTRVALHQRRDAVVGCHRQERTRGPWTTSKHCGAMPSATNASSTNSLAPHRTTGMPWSPTVRWIPGRWRWCGWQPWPRSVVPFRPTGPRRMPQSMPVQAQPRWSTC